MLKALRPELDIFMVTDAPVEDVVGGRSRHIRRLFYLQENYREVHLSVLKGLHERFETPFFNALRRYSQKPTGMFHAAHFPFGDDNQIAMDSGLGAILWP